MQIAAEREPFFLNYCGSEIYALAQTLTNPLPPNSVSWDVLTRELAAHFKPTKPAIVYRHQFFRMAQTEGETINQFATRLRTILAKCNFDNPEARLIDALIFGMRNVSIRNKLLTEDEPSLQSVIKTAQTAEVSVAAATEMKQNDKREIVAKIESPPDRRDFAEDQDVPASSEESCLLLRADQQRKQRQQRQFQPCSGCRGNHPRQKCPFRESFCRRCDRRGHIAEACRTVFPEDTVPAQRPPRQQNSSWQSRDYRPPRASFKESQRNSGNSNRGNNRGKVEYAINNTAARDSKKIIVPVYINNHPCQMELDTGSKFTIMPWEKIKLYMPNLTKAQLEPMTAIIRDFQGGEIPILGKAKVPVSFKNVHCKLPILVVSGPTHTLLGLEWMVPLGITVTGINKISEVTPPNFLREFPDVFNSTLGSYKGPPISFSLDPKIPPTRLKPRRVPLPLLPKLDVQLDKLIAQGILVPVDHAPWETPIVTPLKPDGSLRVCADYKATLNKALQHHSYPIPVVQQLLHSLGEGKLFAKIDLAQAYQQLPVDDQTALAQTIVTHRGAFKCTRLQFGVSVAPGIFQSLMERLLFGIKGTIPYFDDILISGENQIQLNQRIREVLKRLQQKGLKIKAEKCVWGTQSIDFLGYRIDSEGIHPTPEKIRAIQEAPQPQNKTELQAFLGLLNFYSVFLKQKATAAEPLHRLLQKGTPWTWGDDEHRAFANVKQLLSSNSVVVQYSTTLPVRLTCDASPYGVGAVLAHILPNGTEAPVAYFSKTLSGAERNYSQLDKEALALVAGVKKFHNYIFGRKFELVTDHKPLLGLLAENKPTPPFMSPRLIRWTIFLAGYEYTLRHKGGKDINHADGLSRCPLTATVEDPAPAANVLLLELEDNPITTAKEVAECTSRDPILKKVANFVLKGWPKDVSDVAFKEYKNKQQELSYLKGCILWGDRTIIPCALKEKVLELLHRGHPGIVRMKSLARGHLWWPGLDNDIEEWVATCDPCQESRPNPPKTSPMEWEPPRGPWSRVHIDFAGPIGAHSFLIVVDAYSKWVEIINMKNTTSCATIRALRRLFATHGCPDVLVSDNGPQFTSRQMELFLDHLGIRHALISVHAPWANGLAERYVRVAKEALKRSEPGEVQERLDQFLLTQHITPNAKTQKSPAELLMGRKLRSPLDRLHPSYCEDRDVQGNPERHMYLGQTVFARNFDGGANWLKGTVFQQTAPKTYYIRLEDGRLWKRHIDHLRRRLEQATRHQQGTNMDTNQDCQPSISTDSTNRQTARQHGAESNNWDIDIHSPSPQCPSSAAGTTPLEAGGMSADSSSGAGFLARPGLASEVADGPTSSSADCQDSNDLRRSERVGRRPSRLDDFVTWLSE